MLSAATPPIPPLDPSLDPLPRSTLSADGVSKSQVTNPNTEPCVLDSHHTTQTLEVEMGDLEPAQPAEPCLQLLDLPIEIHEAILDHLFGVRGAALGAITSEYSTASTWSKSLRHPRRKALSNLALVSPLWRPLVQERIYRHIQVKGTADSLQESADWFGSHPHLSPYVRHIEIWVPVWGDRLPRSNIFNHNIPNGDLHLALPLTQQNSMSNMENMSAPSGSRSNRHFRFSNRNASLQQIFYHVACFFPEARMLTIEGGHCRKPPMIKQFDNDPWGHSGLERLEVLPNIQCFTMRGAWNIMRDYQHWRNLSEALPNLREWNCTYAKPKPEAHLNIKKILQNFPARITRLTIGLDGLCSKNNSHLRWFNVNAHNEQHFCRQLGEVMPQLESLTFTGKTCATLFTYAKSAMMNAKAHPKLKSVDIVVKACCAEPGNQGDTAIIHGDFTGVGNLSFIAAFENLVVSAISSLDVFTALDYLRIRYIDLDSICGQLNPYFQLKGNTCSGIWSDKILTALQTARPSVQFEELSDGILPEHGISLSTGNRGVPRTRPKGIRVGAYKIIADIAKV
ncbi:hypothetical protein VTO42DRAFT_7659 [Malbranchea cinnamomea]